MCLATVLILLGATPVQMAPPLPDEWHLRVENLTRVAMRFWRVPGVAVAVVHDGKVLLVQGFGTTDIHSDKGPLVTGDTLFPIASCTKSFTTTRMQQLVQAGKLKWDDPLVKHLPWFQLSDPDATARVTLRDAASHRGGIASHDLLWYHMGGTMRQRVERLGRLPVQWPAGTHYAYQTSLFTALGLVEEAVDPRPWEKQLEAELLEPLGMTSTWADPHAIPPSIIQAKPHRLDATDLPVFTDAYPFDGPDPAGSIHSTAGDMAKWVAFQMGNGLAPGGQRLLSPESLDELHSSQISQPLTLSLRGLNPSAKSMGYALGFTSYDHRGEPVVAHGGAADGMRAQITLLPGKKLGFVVLANLNLTRMNLALTHHLVDLFLEQADRDYNGLVMKQQRRDLTDLLDKARLAGEKAIRLGSTAQLQTMEGVYTHPAYGEAVLFTAGGVTQLRLGATATRLRPIGPGCWLAEAEQFAGAVVDYQAGAPPQLIVGGEVNLPFTRKP